MPEDQPRGIGQRLVELLCCTEDVTDRVQHVLPSVDHFAMQRKVPNCESVLAGLRREGPAGLVEPFERWRDSVEGFYAAVSDLRDTRRWPALRPDDYQRQLGERIALARQRRREVEKAADSLRGAVTDLIDSLDSAATHGAPTPTA